MKRKNMTAQDVRALVEERKFAQRKAVIERLLYKLRTGKFRVSDNFVYVSLWLRNYDWRWRGSINAILMDHDYVLILADALFPFLWQFKIGFMSGDEREFQSDSEEDEESLNDFDSEELYDFFIDEDENSDS